MLYKYSFAQQQIMFEIEEKQSEARANPREGMARREVKKGENEKKNCNNQLLRPCFIQRYELNCYDYVSIFRNIITYYKKYLYNSQK